MDMAETRTAITVDTPASTSTGTGRLEPAPEPSFSSISEPLKYIQKVLAREEERRSIEGISLNVMIMTAVAARNASIRSHRDLVT